MGQTASRNSEPTRIKSLEPCKYPRPFCNPLIQMTSRVLKSKEELAALPIYQTVVRTNSSNKQSINSSSEKKNPNSRSPIMPLSKSKLNFTHCIVRLNSFKHVNIPAKIAKIKVKANVSLHSSYSKKPKIKKAAAKKSINKVAHPIKNENRVSIAHVVQPKFNDRVHFDKVSLLPPFIFYRILSFDMNEIRKYLSVSPSWHTAVLMSMDEIFNKVENRFVQAYSSHLLFVNSYTSSSKINFCDLKGTKVDRVFTCEIFPACKGCTVTIGYSYSYIGEYQKYAAHFQFECISNLHRVMWIHKNSYLVLN